jgi:hypothetical protein
MQFSIIVSHDPLVSFTDGIDLREDLVCHLFPSLFNKCLVTSVFCLHDNILMALDSKIEYELGLP